ncbi:MAG: hypothetical protein AAFR81_06635 [Chloroflexota bacterium]
MAEHLEKLEQIAQDICDEFDVYAPPVPLELMLQEPKEDMWEELDINQLSGSFMKLTERYSPRMSLARMLARHIVRSDWGAEHGLQALVRDKDTLKIFARMLIMPREMVNGLTSSMKNPKIMSTHFEAPESEAEARLFDLV